MQQNGGAGAVPPPGGGGAHSNDAGQPPSAMQQLAVLLNLVQQHRQQQQQPAQPPAQQPPVQQPPSLQSVWQQAAPAPVQPVQPLASAWHQLPPAPVQPAPLQQPWMSLPQLPLPPLPDPGAFGGGFGPPPAALLGRGGGEPYDGPGALKVRITCNDVPGALHLDNLYVACECPQCDARVAMGHGRPIFGLSRFERHCGSKAKKWRISLRVEPGSCPEVRHGDPPMAIGDWLNLRGIGVKSNGDRAGSGDEAGLGPGAKRARWQSFGGGEVFGGDAGAGPRMAAVASHQALHLGGDGGEPGIAAWELALLEGPGENSSVTEQFLRHQGASFRAEQAAAQADAARAADAGAPAGHRHSQHSAIFRLVLALLEGPATQHLLGEVYMPWLNELPPELLARQHATFTSYLNLLQEGMDWHAVHRQLLAYLRGTLRRVMLAKTNAAAEAAAEPPPDAPRLHSGASPVTAPSAEDPARHEQRPDAPQPASGSAGAAAPAGTGTANGSAISSEAPSSSPPEAPQAEVQPQQEQQAPQPHQTEQPPQQAQQPPQQAQQAPQPQQPEQQAQQPEQPEPEQQQEPPQEPPPQ